MFILEMITLLTVVGTICYLTEKFVIKKDSECNDS